MPAELPSPLDHQRRSRTRAALAAAATVAVVLAFGVGYALVGDDGGDALTSGPGGAAASAAASAGPSPVTSPSGAAEKPAADVSAALLTLADVRRAEPGDWAPGTTPEDGPLLDPCPGGTAYPRDPDRVDRAYADLQSLREAGGTGLRQTLARYVSEPAAADALDGYRRAVEGCPRRTDAASDVVVTHEVLDGPGEQDGVRTLLVRLESGCAQQCVGGYAYLAVHQVGDLLSVVTVGIGEDGDPGADLARPFFDAARDRLRDAA